MSTSPAQIGRYRIVSELGRGAMGVVYGAEDPMLSRKVAIKTILMSADLQERAEYEPRFYQEAKAAGSLNHPNIITIYDIGREGDMAFMAMELIEGVELRSLILNGQLTLPRALNIAAQVAEGIASAHEKGVIHRDIKPGNVMVLRGDVAKIMDFGIARLRTSDVKTATGMLLGSPKYMSPEQIVGRALDHRSDIFSLGVVIYEMIVGVAPFNGPDLPALMHAIAGAEPAPPSRMMAGAPRMLDLIIAKALAKKVDDRYQDARELAADLRACREALPAQAPQAPAGDSEKTQRLDGNAFAATQPQAYADTQPLSETSATDPALINTVPLAQMDAGRAFGAAPLGGANPNAISQGAPRPGATPDTPRAGTAPSTPRAGLTPGTPRAGATPAGADPRYAVSPRFDASATLMKLKAPSAAPAAHEATIAGTTRRIRKSPERLFIASAIVLALIAAVLIAVL
jgi:serine/threonine-protein kinase